MKDRFHIKLGDRNRVNCLPLFSLLSILIRSAKLQDETDFDVSDSDSSIEDKSNSHSNKVSIVSLNNSYMTNNCLQAFANTGLLYDLPRRDTYFVSRRDLMESILNEVSYQDVKIDQREPQNDLIGVVCDIASHICFNDLEKTLSICALAQRIIKDRKAHESILAVRVLTSLLHLRDTHLNQRIKSVTSSIFEGIDANSEFEKELLMLLGALQVELLKRTPGSKGEHNEVIFHGIIVEKLETIISLFGQNIPGSVKHKILGLVSSLLQTRSTPTSLQNDENIFTKSISLAYSGHSLDGEYYFQKNINSDTQSEDPASKCNELEDYLEDDFVRDKIFVALKDLHMNIADAISSQCSQTISDGIVSQGPRNNLNYSQLLESSTFYEYFAVLRKCLDGANIRNRLSCDKEWVHDITRYLLPVFWEVDNGGRNHTRSSSDILKGEMIMFFERLAQVDFDQFVSAFLDDHLQSSSGVGSNATPDPITKMLEVFVTSNNNFIYNDSYMAHFYSLLALLAEKNEEFYKAVLIQGNWQWAFRTFVLNKNVAKPGRLYDVLLHNTVKFVEDDEKFRKEMYTYLMPSDCDKTLLDSKTPDTAVLRLLAAIFDSELLHHEQKKKKIARISEFVSGDCGGMSKISSIMTDLFSQLSQPETLVPGEYNFENISYCIECMISIMNALDTKEVKILLSEGWPEVDEINFILTQIITRTEEQWASYQQNHHNAKKQVDRIVVLSKDLQRLLVAQPID